jgi:tRNA-Thr(GGU) m(6)t(6)A37 methyltransferase TsaA
MVFSGVIPARIAMDQEIAAHRAVSRSRLMNTDEYRIHPIGHVRSPLRSRGQAPRQGDEGAPDVWLELDEAVLAGLHGIAAGQELIVLTWLHQARRDVLQVHPRGDATRPLAGVFATRSPDRPNPIGLHHVRVIELARARLRVGPLEAIDGTPVVDIKPVLAGRGAR